MLDTLMEDETPERLIYIEENIPLKAFEEGLKHRINPEDCLSIKGVRCGKNFMPYSHVIRVRKDSEVEVYLKTENMPHPGNDKLVFYNFDVHGNFYWGAVYSTALFLGGDGYEIFI